MVEKAGVLGRRFQADEWNAPGLHPRRWLSQSSEMPMSTTTPPSQESIDAEPTAELRTRRACEGCMVVVPEGEGTGIFDVYSANDGKNETYTVDLKAETCECGDYKHRQPPGGCKHIRRVKLGLGLMPLPAVSVLTAGVGRTPPSRHHSLAPARGPRSRTGRARSRSRTGNGLLQPAGYTMARFRGRTLRHRCPVGDANAHLQTGERSRC